MTALETATTVIAAVAAAVVVLSCIWNVRVQFAEVEAAVARARKTMSAVQVRVEKLQQQRLTP